MGQRRTDDVCGRCHTRPRFRRYPQDCSQPLPACAGVGAQGGSLEEVCKYGMNSTCGLIVNSSRGIIYVDKTEKFAEAARNAAKEVQQQMAEQLKGVINA